MAENSSKESPKNDNRDFMMENSTKKIEMKEFFEPQMIFIPFPIENVGPDYTEDLMPYDNFFFETHAWNFEIWDIK